MFRGRCDQERNSGRSFPAGPFPPVLFLTEMPAVVAPEDDQGVPGVGSFFKRLEDPADLGVDKGDAGEVGANRGFPLAVFEYRGVGAGRHRLKSGSFARAPEVGQISF